MRASAGSGASCAALRSLSVSWLVQEDGGATPGWAAGATPAAKPRSRWDETPVAGQPPHQRWHSVRLLFT